MAKVKFNLKKGFCIANYRILKRLGSGCTAEAYLVVEIPTQVKRVLKIYESFDDNQRIQNLKNFEHYCWLLSELSEIKILPHYYHMGHVYPKDGEGIGQYFMIQEYINGKPFKRKSCTSDMIHEFLKKVSSVHKKGYALGDWSTDNLIIDKNEIRLVDCDYGTHDNPNTYKKVDIKVLSSIFGVKR